MSAVEDSVADLIDGEAALVLLLLACDKRSAFREGELLIAGVQGGLEPSN